MVLQTSAGIWWASGLDAKVTNQGKSIEKVEAAVAAMTAAEVVVMKAEISRLQAELLASRALRN